MLSAPSGNKKHSSITGIAIAIGFRSYSTKGAAIYQPGVKLLDTFPHSLRAEGPPSPIGARSSSFVTPNLPHLLSGFRIGIGIGIAIQIVGVRRPRLTKNPKGRRRIPPIKSALSSPSICSCQASPTDQGALKGDEASAAFLRIGIAIAIGFRSYSTKGTAIYLEQVNQKS